MDGESRGNVVITGASTGIGRAAAEHLDELGFEVFAGVRKEADAESIRAAGSERLRPLRIDVAEQDSIDAARNEVAAAVGDRGLAGLVNNAGVGVGGPLEFLPVDEIRRQLEVNLFGQIAVTQAFLPLIRAGRGRIVNIGSVGGRIVYPFMAPYHMSKWGMEAYSDALRQELQPWDIKVSLIEPGSIKTEIWGKGQETARELRARLPEAEPMYGEALESFQKMLADSDARGIPPQRVAKRIAHALTARRPRTRYLVGADARIMSRARRLLGDRGFDRAVARVGGLPKRGSRAGGQ